MISYLCISRLLEIVLQDSLPNLPHLIGLNMSATALQVDDFHNTVFVEEMVVAPNSL